MRPHRLTATRAVAVAIVLVLSSCSVLGDDGSAVSVDDLRELMPTTDELGAGWSVDLEEDDGDDSMEVEEALREQCPEFAEIATGAGDGNDDDQFERRFVNADHRELEVTLERGAKAAAEGELAAMIGKIDACEVTVDDAETGMRMTMDLVGEVVEDHGDEGLSFGMDLVLTHPRLPAPVAMGAEAIIFRVGSVGVTVFAFDGLNPDTLQVTPRGDVGTAVARQVEAEVRAMFPESS